MKVVYAIGKISLGKRKREKGRTTMKIEFNQMTEKRLPAFKGGAGELIARMYTDELGKLLYGKLEPGSSIGYHKHETNSEIIYILEGSGKCLYEGEEEKLTAGDCHYCPKGHSHSLINDSDADMVFFAVIPEQ